MSDERDTVAQDKSARYVIVVWNKIDVQNEATADEEPLKLYLTPPYM